MAILDGQNYFSNLQNGDSPTAIADNASAYFIDQGVGGLNFFAPGGGAYIAPWAIVQVATAFTSGGSATIIAALQDAPDPSTSISPSGPTTWTDKILGPTFTVGGASAPSINQQLLAQRILPSHARYLRIVYRIGAAVMTGGTAVSFLMPDQDVVDISMRKVGVYVTQANQLSEAVAQAVLLQ